MPSSFSGSSCSRSAARNLSSLPAAGRRRMMPSAAPRPCPRLMVMRATARIMFLKRAMICLRPIGRIRQRGAIGRAVEHLEGRGGIQAEIFRAALMRDIAPGFQKAVDRDALLEMLAVVPPVEFGLVGRIDVHRRQQHSFSGERHFCDDPYPVIFEARSAIAFITASRTPGSYSEWPAPSTKRTSESGHAAASACEVAGGHSRS